MIKQEKKQNLLNLKGMHNSIPKKSEKLNQILLNNVQPYLGCTDISIIALGTALATQAAFGNVPRWVDPNAKIMNFEEIQSDDILYITFQINDSLFKTSHATIIPQANGHKGYIKAAGLGIFLNPEEKLNIYFSVNEQIIKQMVEVIANTKIQVETINLPSCNLYFRSQVILRSKGGKIISGEAILKNSYTGVIFLGNKTRTLFNKPSKPNLIENQLLMLDIPQFVNLLNELSPDVYDRIERTIELNTKAYQYGILKGPGLGIGKKYDQLIQKGIIGDDMVNRAASKTAAAEDVRMGGENISVMGISGSGSHGIASSIPIITVAHFVPKNRKRLIKSIALSFWITEQMNSLVGHLSAPCGCVIKSGIGVTAGITYYLSGNLIQIEQAINNYIISTAGVICDGAKTTCSIKLANGASCAVKSALLALEGVEISHNEGGIVREDLQTNIENIIKISKNMQNIDSIIVDIIKSY